MRSLQWYKRGAAYKWGWRVGEGWWRVRITLHPCKLLIYRDLRRFCEGWRVFLKVALYSSDSAKLLRKMWGFGQKVLRKMWESVENSFGKCDFLYVILWFLASFVKEAKKRQNELSAPVSCHTSEMRIPRCWIFLSICSLFSERSWRLKAKI